MFGSCVLSLNKKSEIHLITLKRKYFLWQLGWSSCPAYNQKCYNAIVISWPVHITLQYFQGRIFWYSTLLHLPSLRFHCVEGCWDQTQDCCDFALTARCSNHLAISHLQWLYLIHLGNISSILAISHPPWLYLIHAVF
jgi:hypothetical protein